MNRIVTWAAANRGPSILLCIGLILAGGYSLYHLPIDAVPDVTNVQVQVVTRASALSALEVETQVTQPIERAMAGVPGLVQTRSITKFGISLVTLIFRDDIDTYFARMQVNERLTLVRDLIPSEVGRPELGPIATALGEIYMFELKPDGAVERSSEELRTIIEWQIAPKLRQIPGVIEVVGFGGALKQYRVTLEPMRLAAHSISLEEVQAALKRDNQLSGGGYIEKSGEQVVLRGDAIFRSLEDIAGTVVRTERGVPIRVGQLGTVDTGPALRQGAMTRDGRGEVVGASVLMLKGQNSRDVVTRVKEGIAALKPFLPAGVVIDPYYDRAEFINSVLKTISKNLSEGALIVVGCLLLTLGSLRAGLLVAGAIPFSMLIGFIGLSLLGYSGNVMSLGAIDFGIIVEGAVIAIEHAMSHGATLADTERRRKAVIHALTDVARPAAFGVAITLLVFLPLATLEDVEGKMFRPVVFSLCFMLFGSMIYTLVLLPAISPVLLRAKPGTEDPWFSRILRRWYEPRLAWVLDHKRLTLMVSFGVTIFLLGWGAKLGSDFLPRVFEGSFAIDALRPPSTSLTQAIALGRETELALKSTPEVLTVVNRIGRPEDAVDPAGPESSDVFVILKPRSEWRSGVDPERLVDELSEKVGKAVPATINAFSQPIEMRVNDLIAGVKSDVAIKVFGDDLNQIYDVADQLRRSVAQIPGAADVKMEIPTGLPAIQVKVNRERAGRIGVSPESVLGVLSAARAGIHAGVVREGERVFDLMLRIGGEQLTNAADIGRLPIATSARNLIPLSMVSQVHEERTVVQISREQMRRRLTVSVNVRGRDMVGFVNEAQNRAKSIQVPRSVEVVWGGQFQNFNRAKARLSLLVPVALLIILFMLMAAYKSVLYAFVTVLILPFALAGGVIGLVIRGLPFSIPAGVGFIAVSGISVITGIVLTTALLESDPKKSPRERVFESALRSFRAPVSTALIAAVGFIPAAIATGSGAEVQRPLATVVIGGLIVSMFLSMAALPVMLLWVSEKKAERDVAIDL